MSVPAAERNTVQLHEYKVREQFPDAGVVLVTGHEKSGKSTMAWTLGMFARSRTMGRPAIMVSPKMHEAMPPDELEKYPIYTHIFPSFTPGCCAAIEQCGTAVVVVDDCASAGDILAQDPAVPGLLASARVSGTLFVIAATGISLPPQAAYTDIVDAVFLLRCNREADRGWMLRQVHTQWTKVCVTHLEAFETIVRKVTHHPMGWVALVYDARLPNSIQRLSFFRTNPSSFKTKFYDPAPAAAGVL
jgi:energy-coupling factor transporter ATP-binding protein EcfA2